MGKDLGTRRARKISINFPQDLWKQLRLRALEDDTTVTEILVRLSRDYLAKGEKKRRSR
jgi:hypothetical protein